MSFLQPLLLIALPLALLPVIIHLIHLHRRRAVRWAATMFLRAAQRMNQGLSKLRQYLILALRVLALAALILMAGRPLAGGLLGLTGGAPDTVLLLIDRSASMEQQNLATGLSKRATGRTIYLLDEPTTGLHFADIHKLLEVLMKLRNARNTLIVIEHNLEVIKCADWILDLGPGGGSGGGQIVAQGTPEQIAKSPASHTGGYLSKYLKA